VEVVKDVETENKQLKEKLQEKNEYISKLEAKLEKMEAKLEAKLEKLESTVTTIALEAKTVSAKPVTTNNTTNHITVTTNTNNFLNLSKEHVNKVLKDNMDYNVVYAGQAGLATFVVEKILTDSDGKLMYYCVDPSRQMFEFTGENGEKIRDLKAEKLIQSLLKGDVIRTGLEEAAKGWNTDDQQLNLERTTVFGPKVSEYAELNRNNTVFRSKVSSLTT
jgi:septin family protein